MNCDAERRCAGIVHILGIVVIRMYVMEKIVIFGAGDVGKRAIIKLRDIYNESVFGCADSYKSGEILGMTIKRIECYDLDCSVVITNDFPKKMKEMYAALKSYGFKNIFWYLNLDDRPREISGFLKDECIRINNWGDELLPDLEVHIADNCNLNCKGCTHFSPLFRSLGVEFDSRVRDISCIRKKVSNIARLDILGGEPLLNKEIGRYIVEIRRLLPDTRINVFTNGTLIPSMNKELFSIIRDNGVYFMISEYPPLVDKTEKIKDILFNENIRYQVTPVRDKFNLPLSVSRNSNLERICISDGCVCVRDGLIGRCPTLMYIYKFNEKFDTNLPEDGIIPIESCPSGNELLDFLEQPVPLCNHCVKNEIPWETCGTDMDLGCFAVEE